MPVLLTTVRMFFWRTNFRPARTSLACLTSIEYTARAPKTQASLAGVNVEQISSESKDL
jgi:hypothetical protein